MNTNLEALVKAATGAHPIPEQEQAAAAAATAAMETIHEAESDIGKQSTAESDTGTDYASTITGKEDLAVGVSQEATEEAIAASAAVERSVMEDATMAEMSSSSMIGNMADVTSVHHPSSDMGEEEEVAARNHFAYIDAANAAVVAEADVAAAAAAVAAVEASELQQQQQHSGVATLNVPSLMESVPTAYSKPEGEHELSKNIGYDAETRIAERRRKGWVKKTWDERLEELKAFKEIHGHANVPTISKENPSLGHWVHDQRKQYRLFQENKQTAMTPERIRLLEDVGFKWALQRHTAMKSWNERFEELKKYKAEKGDCNVPIRYKENPSLGQWVSTQRQEYGAKIKGRRSNTTQERIKALEEIGFQWFLRDTSKMAPRKSWESHFQCLVSFKEKHGHCDVRVRSKQHPTGSLGRWVEKQRHHYNTRKDGMESKITDEQIQRLEDLGFRWRVRNEKKAVAERREKIRAEAGGQVNRGGDISASMENNEAIANIESSVGSTTVDPTIMNVDMLTVPDVSALHAEMNRAAIAAVEATSAAGPNAVTILGDSIDLHGVALPDPGSLGSAEMKVEQEFQQDGTSAAATEGTHNTAS